MIHNCLDTTEISDPKPGDYVITEQAVLQVRDSGQLFFVSSDVDDWLTGYIAVHRPVFLTLMWGSLAHTNHEANTHNAMLDELADLRDSMDAASYQTQLG